MSALLADLKDFLADVPNERGVGDGMKAWAKELLHRLNAASTQNILDVADHEGMFGDEGVSTASRKCSGEVMHDLSGRATGSQKQRIDAEMRLIFRSSSSTTLDPADDPRFA